MAKLLNILNGYDIFVSFVFIRILVLIYYYV